MQIEIPFHSRSEALNADALIDLPKGLADPDERRVCRSILFRLWSEGAKTMGAALDRLDRATPDQRRGLVDAARQENGLPTLEELEDAARREAAKPAIIGYTSYGQPITFADRRYPADA